MPTVRLGKRQGDVLSSQDDRQALLTGLSALVGSIKHIYSAVNQDIRIQLLGYSIFTIPKLQVYSLRCSLNLKPYRAGAIVPVETVPNAGIHLAVIQTVAPDVI